MKITIKNYKLIKEVKLELEKNKLNILIGKNGSGKSTILESLIGSQNNYQINDQKTKFIFEIKIPSAKFNKVNKELELNLNYQENCFIYLENDGRQNKTIKSNFLAKVKEKLLDEIKSTNEEIDNYLKILVSEYSENNIKISPFIIKWNDNEKITFIKKTMNLCYTIEDLLGKNHITWDIHYANELKMQNNNNKYWPTVEPKKIEFNNFILNSLSLSEKNISNLNQKIEEECELKNIEIKNKLTELINDATEKLNNKIDSIRELIIYIHKDIKFPKNFINLNNKIDFSNMFPSQENTIFKIMDKFCKENNLYNENESIFNGGIFINKNNNINPERMDFIILEFNKYLKKLEINFDKNFQYLILKKRQDSNGYSLLIKELNGFESDFNATSEGRKWYFLYLFIESTISQGDVLILDEPATNLHPSAQKIFLENLEKLTKKGIYVLYSTHNPELISENIDYYNQVEIINNEISIKKIHKLNELKEIIGIAKSRQLIFEENKTLILVEGENDKLIINHIAKLLNFNFKKNEIFSCDGCYNFPYVEKYLNHVNKKYKTILDLDCFDGDIRYKNKAINETRWKNFIKKTKEPKRKDKYYYVGKKDKNQSIEDFFDIEFQKKFFKQQENNIYKIDPTRIKQINEKDLNNDTKEKLRKLLNWIIE